MKGYLDIIFFQEWEAEEAIAILESEGEIAAIEHLSQWDNGDSGIPSPTLGAGTMDTIYRNGSYILTYNLSLPYIGLSKYGDF